MSIKETTVEIKLKNLKNNLDYLKSQINSQTKFMAVVKAFSYGSDSRVVSKELEQLGVNYLAVAYTQEGVDLRKIGIKIPILVLHPQENDFDPLHLVHQLPLVHCDHRGLWTSRSVLHLSLIGERRHHGKTEEQIDFVGHDAGPAIDGVGGFWSAFRAQLQHPSLFHRRRQARRPFPRGAAGG